MPFQNNSLGDAMAKMRSMRDSTARKNAKTLICVTDPTFTMAQLQKEDPTQFHTEEIARGEFCHALHRLAEFMMTQD